MALSRLRLLLLMWLFSVAVAAGAWADPAGQPQTVDPGSPQGVAIIRAAVDGLVGELGKPAALDAKQLKVMGEWAFLYASMRGASGEPIDYTGTPYADAAAHHAKSRSYAGLLQRSENSWAITTQAVGPTDPAWLAWPQQYGVPSALVEVPAD